MTEYRLEYTIQSIMESTPTIKPKKNIVKKIILGIIIGAVIFANAWMAVQYHFDFATSNSLSGVLADVKGIPSQWMYQIAYWQQDRAYSKELNQPVSPNYNNSDDSTQIIQAGVNTASISEEELPSLLGDTIPLAVKDEFPKPTILLPFKLTDGEKVEVETYWTAAYNPITPELSGEPLASGKIFTISKKGTEIIVPTEESKITFGTTTVNNKAYLNGYGIYFNGSDGTEYCLDIQTEDMRSLQPTDLIEKAILNNENNLNLPVSTSLATTSADNVKVKIALYAYPPGYPKDKVGLHCNYNLITQEANDKTVVAFMPQNVP